MGYFWRNQLVYVSKQISYLFTSNSPLGEENVDTSRGRQTSRFPDWFDFVKGGQTKRSDLAKWIGDAVPSLMDYFVGLSLSRSWK